MHYGAAALLLSTLSRLGFLLGVVLLSGCSTVGYYSQAVSGHLAIMRARVPVAELVADPQTEPGLRRSLERSQRARRFAIEELGLPDNGSYTTFVALDRGAVTWNVIATPRYSVNPERWCFPIAGCLSYRGYFDRADAEAYAQSLSDQGLDVAITAAGAYSSLGWFEDPLLSTMVARGEPLLAGVIFHELAHQQLYVADDSAFNESYASFIEQQGIRAWLAHIQRPGLQRHYDDWVARRDAFIALLLQTRHRLVEAYSGEADEADLELRKQQVFKQLRTDYEALKASWGGYAGYDTWFEQPLNNARVAGVSTYNQWVGAFERLFRESGDEYAQFYRRAAALAALPRAERDRALRGDP